MLQSLLISSHSIFPETSKKKILKKKNDGRKLERRQDAAHVQKMLTAGVKSISASSTGSDRKDWNGREQAQSEVQQEDI